MTATFVAVVGPSGAGKDTLIDFARTALADEPDFAFPQRVITRPHGAGGEDHVAATREQFEHMQAKGGFLIDWEAHSLLYGIPVDAAVHLADGVHVIANLSRAAIEPLSARVEHIEVIHVTAPLEIIAERLARRGRESANDIRQRLARADYVLPTIASVTTINNAGPAEHGGAEFVRALVSISRSCSSKSRNGSHSGCQK